MSMPTGSPSRKSPVRVFHVDDHAVMRIGLQQLLSQRGFEICGEAGDPDSAFSGVERSHPDVTLVDLNLRGYDGIQLLHDLHQRWPTIPLVAYTMHEDPSYVERAFAAGAIGFVCKGDPSSELLAAITAALKGERVVSSGAARALPDWPAAGGTNERTTTTPPPQSASRPDEKPAQPHGPFALRASCAGASADCTGLPNRPREILALLAEGFSVSEIAANLRLSRKTVETHCTRLCEHFGIDGQRELARLAIQRKQPKQ